MRLFHSTVAKLLFIVKSARPDILLTVSYLTTRVKEPDQDDWHQLIRLLGCLKHMSMYPLKLSCTNLERVCLMLPMKT
jgi:hypothetical protein